MPKPLSNEPRAISAAQAAPVVPTARSLAGQPQRLTLAAGTFTLADDLRVQVGAPGVSLQLGYGLDLGAAQPGGRLATPVPPQATQVPASNVGDAARGPAPRNFGAGLVRNVRDALVSDAVADQLTFWGSYAFADKFGAVPTAAFGLAAWLASNPLKKAGETARAQRLPSPNGPALQVQGDLQVQKMWRGMTLEASVASVWRLPNGALNGDGKIVLRRGEMELMKLKLQGWMGQLLLQQYQEPFGRPVAQYVQDLSANLEAAAWPKALAARLQDGDGPGFDMESAARTAYNVMLDRTRLQGSIALNAGHHTISGLGLEAGLRAAGELRLKVAPDTVASFTSGAIDQRPPAPRTSSFARLAAALGTALAAIWRLVKSVFVAAPRGDAAAPDLTTTHPTDRLYTHGLELHLSKPVRLSFGNWTHRLLSAHVRGASVDEHGGLTPHGSIRLGGVPVWPLTGLFMKRIMDGLDLNLTTDPHRLLWQGEILAAEAPVRMPRPAAANETLYMQEQRLADDAHDAARDVVAQSERSAHAQGLLGALLGAIRIDITPFATKGARLQQELAMPGAAPLQLQLFANDATFRLHYNLHRFEEPIALEVHDFKMVAQLTPTMAPADARRFPLRLGKLVAHGMWADPLAATEWLDATAYDLHLSSRSASGRLEASMLQLSRAGVDLQSGTLSLRGIRPPWAVAGLRAVATKLGGLFAAPLVNAAFAMFDNLAFEEHFAELILTQGFVPGAPKSTVKAVTAAQRVAIEARLRDADVADKAPAASLVEKVLRDEENVSLADTTAVNSEAVHGAATPAASFRSLATDGSIATVETSTVQNAGAVDKAA